MLASGRRFRMLLALAACLAPTLAGAEKADREKETLIVGDHQTVDDLKQISIFTGHVILTKGTIRVTGDRMDYREDPDGYQYAVVTGSSDSLATFHERGDPTKPGVEQTFDGVAERIEYDNRNDTVKLFTHAVVRRYENGVLRDEFTGDQITYDARTSHYDLQAGSNGRVTARIAPRATEGASAPAPAPAPSAPGAGEASRGSSK